MDRNIFGVIMFERPVVAPMKVDENRQDFAEGKGGLAAAVAMARLKQRLLSVRQSKRNRTKLSTA
jgi:hypothetical protein